MVTEEIRSLLYYPLGVLPSLFFSLRILIQWVQSEQKKTSYVGSLFWRLSIAGNLLLMSHYFLQMQLPFFLIQALNAFIAWRNLSLIGGTKVAHSTVKTLVRFIVVLGLGVLAFAIQGMLIGEFVWMRMPTQAWHSVVLTHAYFWHFFGAVGGAIFASRFWMQWWQAEKFKKSELRASFWWLSICGCLMMLIYFIRIQDNVSILNYSFSLVPYIRNLILIRKRRYL